VQAYDITLTAGTFEIDAPLEGTGNDVLVLQPADADAAIDVCADTGATFSLDVEDLDSIVGGFRDVIIGREDGAHAFTLGAYTFGFPVLFRAPLEGGAFDVIGTLRTQTP
jgi:hypothetical protein